MKQQYANVPCKSSWETKVLASWKKWPKRHGRLCGVYLVTSLSSLDFGTCLILFSFSWLKWFQSNYDILRVDSADVWDVERVAQFWPSPQMVDGIWMEDCTTASWQQQHAVPSRWVEKPCFYCWHAAVPNTMRLVWTCLNELLSPPTII